MSEKNLVETFSYLVRSLKKDHPDLAYLHVTQPRVAGGFSQDAEAGESLDFVVRASDRYLPMVS